jgi:hypothetical protein
VSTPSPEPGSDEDIVPVSVRLGTVVPPEDPEDWGKPLTWAAAAGMLLGPVAALCWFWLAPPLATDAPVPGTWIVAVGLVVGASLTGATQRGAVRATVATLGAALFAALATVVVGAVTAGDGQVGAAPPTLAHAFAASVAGTIGAVAAGLLAWPLADLRSRVPRVVAPTAAGGGAAILVVALIFR